MTNAPATRRIILVLGMPDAGLDAAVHALHTAGAGTLPSPDDLGPIERLAARLPAALGISAEDPGPLAMAGRTIDASAARIDADLDAQFALKAQTLLRALVAPGPAVLLRSASILLLPRFWLRAIAAAGITAEVILVQRNPLALSGIDPATAARTVRRAIFAWHYLTSQLLVAAPEALVVPTLSLLSGAPIDPRLGGEPGARWSAAGLSAHPREEADLAAAPVASTQAGDLATLLHGWNSLPRNARHEAAQALATRLTEAMAATGVARPPARRIGAVGRPHAKTDVPQASAEPLADLSPLILHYHIFKNAGTSVDRMLKANFGDTWIEHEFVGGSIKDRQEQVRAFLSERPTLKAFSSHTAMLPEPDLPGRRILPIIFMRHPLLRLRSAYQFERQQNAQTRGAILAKSTDLKGYLETLLADGKLRLARNFQAFRFAAGTPGRREDERARALETVQRLPFVGLVEAYDQSMARLEGLVAPLLPEFRGHVMHANATSTDAGLIDEKLARLRDELGSTLYDRLLEENALDLELFERVRATYTPI